jgi:circadian clock protein KaiB
MIATPKDSRSQWNLSLYVAGKDHPNSQLAYANVIRICEEHLPGEYNFKVIDICEDPDAAVEEQILALPTLVRKSPKPTRRIIGDLTDTDRVLICLGVKEIDTSAALES